MLVSGNFDWPADTEPVVLDVRPTQGHRLIQFGVPYHAGAFAGMNETGLVVCATRVDPPSIDTTPQNGPNAGDAPTGPPLALVLRTVLQDAGGVDDALARLGDLSGLRGYHVLVAGAGAGPAADRVGVLEYGEEVRVRRPENGFVLGVRRALWPPMRTILVLEYVRFGLLLGLPSGPSARVHPVIGVRVGVPAAEWIGLGLLGGLLFIPLLERVLGLTYLRPRPAVELANFPAFLLVSGM